MIPHLDNLPGDLVNFYIEETFLDIQGNLYIYKDRPRDQQNMVLIHRGPLYAGSIGPKSIHRGTCKMWSL